MFDDEEEEPGFWQRHRALAVIGVLLLLAGGVYGVKSLMETRPAASRPEAFTMVTLPPPPPPPPKPTPPPEQPPPEQVQPEQKMMEQAPVQEEKKEAPKEKAPDAPAPLGTSITGPGGGPDMGLGSGLGGGGGYGRGGGGGGGSKFGWYASQVQSRIADALRRNPRTHKASLKITVRIWADSTGRVSRAHLAGSTGDATLDAAIQNDVLTGLQLSEPPPADMPMPIVMRLSAQRPR